VGVEPQLQIDKRHEDERITLALTGELDMASADLLEQALAGAEIESKPMVVLDLQQIDFIDSTGLRIVLATLERCRDRGQQFAITPGSPQVQRLLSVTGLGEHLPIVPPAGEMAA
jgi:anti-sigma B factor antagonist